MNLSIEKLNVSLGKNHILKDLSIEISSGEFVSILGISGSGKTTLIKAIAGLVDIGSGDIRLDNKSIINISPEKRKTVIVFQDLRLFPNMNVYENIAFPMKINKKSKEEIDLKVSKLLESVELIGYEKRKVSKLSGGQMQRVALARALASEPNILLLDEPFSGLDESLRKNMGKLIKRLHLEKKITTIMITHDKKEAMYLSDKVAIIEVGKILQYASPSKLYLEPDTKEIASFMGEANFFSGNIENNKFKFSLGELDLDRLFIKEDENSYSSSYDLLVRPNDLYINKVYSEKQEDDTSSNLYKLEDISYAGEICILSLESKDDKVYTLSVSYDDFVDLALEKGKYLVLGLKDIDKKRILFRE